MNAPIPEPPAIADDTWASYWGQRAAELIAAIEQLPGVEASISLTLHYQMREPSEASLQHFHELRASLAKYTLTTTND